MTPCLRLTPVAARTHACLCGPLAGSQVAVCEHIQGPAEGGHPHLLQGEAAVLHKQHHFTQARPCQLGAPPDRPLGAEVSASQLRCVGLTALALQVGMCHASSQSTWAAEQTEVVPGMHTAHHIMSPSRTLQCDSCSPDPQHPRLSCQSATSCVGTAPWPSSSTVLLCPVCVVSLHSVAFCTITPLCPNTIP